jgi:hypothetical protein
MFIENKLIKSKPMILYYKMILILKDIINGSFLKSIILNNIIKSVSISSILSKINPCSATVLNHSYFPNVITVNIV